MPGTLEGAAKARETIRQRFGVTSDGKSALHVRIGALGGRNGTTGGFAANRELASIAGRKGGLKSRRKRNQGSEWEANSAKSNSTTNTTKHCQSCGSVYVQQGIADGHCQVCAPDFKDAHTNKAARELIEESRELDNQTRPKMWSWRKPL